MKKGDITYRPFFWNKKMLKAFDHIAVPMEQVDSMLEFYTALGCQILDQGQIKAVVFGNNKICLLYTSPSPRDATLSRMPSSA